MTSSGPRWLKAFTQRLRPTSAVARLVRQSARRYWYLLGLQLFCSVLLVVAEALTFFVIFRLVRGLASGASVAPAIAGLPSFLVLLLMVGGLQITVGILRYVYSFSLATFAAKCEVFVASFVHRFLLSLDYLTVCRYRTGELSHLAAVAPQSIQKLIQLKGESYVDYFLIAVYVAILLKLSLGLSLLIVSMIGIVYCILRFVRPRVRAANLGLSRLHHDISADLTEDIRSLRLLHSTGSLAFAQQRLDRRLEQVSLGLQRLNRLQPLMAPMMDVLPVVVGLLIAALAWWLLGSKGDVLFPNLVTMVLLLQRANFRINRVISNAMSIDNIAGDVKQLQSLLDSSGKRFRRRGGRVIQQVREGVKFENVSFRFPGRDAWAIDSLTLDLPVGSNLAVVGESGSGKSTLADLLAGLFEPTSGRVLVDGVDLRELDLDVWQQQLGIVSQDVILLGGTIRDNITFGLEQIDEARLQKACVAAGAADFIDQLPGGLDHPIGEGGQRLSGGQRQRISLARAFLRNPSLLVLDEATSALDSRSELHVLQALAAARVGRTQLTIAHRLSSIRDADRILVMQQGRVVEHGCHDQLLELDGVYAELWRKQHRSAPIGVVNQP